MPASQLKSLPTLEYEFYEYSTVYREVEELQDDRDDFCSRYLDLKLEAQDILNTLTTWYGEDGNLLLASTSDWEDPDDYDNFNQVEVTDSDKVADLWNELEDLFEELEEIRNDVRALDLEYAELREKIEKADCN